jgi:hypothetical protein
MRTVRNITVAVYPGHRHPSPSPGKSKIALYSCKGK